MLSARSSFLILFAGAVAILGTALGSQYFGGLDPCVLCLWQRYPWALTIGLAGAGAGLAGVRGQPVSVLALLAGAIAISLLANVGIAAYHVGVEQQWWAGPGACSATNSGLTVDELIRQMQSQPIIRCDEIAWSFAGISMAGYNLLASAALGLFGLRLAARLARRASGAA